MPETALVIAVPEAEPLVSDWRAQHDWSAQRGVPAHITLLYPFAPIEKKGGVVGIVSDALGIKRPI